MASTIRIKRSGVSGNPSTLAQGELAYSYLTDNGANGGDRLYVGTGTETGGDAANHVVIGGKYFTDMLDHTKGTLTASSAIIVDENSKIDVLNVDNITLNGNSITTSSGDLTLNPTGDVDVNGNTIINVPTPTQDSDAANKKYVDDEIADITFTISDSSSTDVFSASSGTLTIAGGTGITSAVTDDRVELSITDTGVVAATYGSTTQIPVLTINAQGQVDSAGTVDVATTLTINNDGISILDSDLTFAAGEGLDVAYDSDTNTVTFSGEDASTTNKGVASFDTNDFTVTSGAVSIKDSGVGNSQLENSYLIIGTDAVQLGDTITDINGLTELDVDNIKLDGNTISTVSGGNLIVDPNPVGDSGDLIVLGNLIVQGTTTTINSTELTINDLAIVLADSAGSAAEADGAGLIVNGANANFLYSVSGDKWTLNKDLDIAGQLFLNGVGFEQLVDSEVANLLTAGEGIDLTYNDGANELTIAAELATITNPGVASFDSDQFTVTSGAVTIYQLDGGTY